MVNPLNMLYYTDLCTRSSRSECESLIEVHSIVQKLIDAAYIGNNRNQQNFPSTQRVIHHFLAVCSYRLDVITWSNVSGNNDVVLSDLIHKLATDVSVCGVFRSVFGVKHLPSCGRSSHIISSEIFPFFFFAWTQWCLLTWCLFWEGTKRIIILDAGWFTLKHPCLPF